MHTAIISTVCCVIAIFSSSLITVIARGSSRIASCGIDTGCMYTWECRQRNGISIHVCLKGFLVGSCCHIPRTTNSQCSGPTCVETSINRPDNNLDKNNVNSNTTSSHKEGELADDIEISTRKKSPRRTPHPIITRIPLQSLPVVQMTTSSLFNQHQPQYNWKLRTTKRAIQKTSTRIKSTVPSSTTTINHSSVTVPTHAHLAEWAHTGPSQLIQPFLFVSTIKPVSTLTTTQTATKTRLTKVPFHAKPTGLRKRPTPFSSTTETSTSISKATTQKFDFKRECGVRPLAFSGRIVGGNPSSFGQWPWQVLVKEVAFLGFFSRNKCGGVLITNQFVLSAAHCKPGFFKNFVAVLGEYNPSTDDEMLPSVERNVRKIYPHPNFVSSTFENDLAILELEKPIVFQMHIVPICLPTQNEDFTGKVGFASGFGRLSSGGRHAAVLNHVSVPILSKKQCRDLFRASDTRVNIKDSYLCAGYKEGGKDSCEGDSGGPLAVERSDGRWVLAGIVSNGIKCALPNSPGIYTKIANFVDWIKRRIT